MRLREIKEGWFNFLKTRIKSLDTNDSLKPYFEKRIKDCIDCKFLKITSTNKNSLFLGKCIHCGCIFPALAYSHSKSCPIGKWDSIPSDKSG